MTRQDADSGADAGRARGAVAAVLAAVRGLLAVGLFAGAAYAAYWLNTSERPVQRVSEERSETARLVETVTVRRGSPRVRVRAMGVVLPAEEAVIRPRVSGMITEQAAAFVPGGAFAAGEFLLQIERADYEQAIRQRESDLARARATLKIERGDQAVAEEELELLEADIPQINRDLILRKPQVNQAEAAVRSAEAALGAARLDLERTRLVAPFDGQVVTRATGVGNNVSAGDEVATFVGSESYWVELAVPVSSLRWIDIPRAPGEAGSPATVRYRKAWGPDASRAGEVAQLVGRLEEGSRLARVIVRVPDPLARDPLAEGEPELILDAFVEVTIEGRAIEDGFRVDRDLIREGDAVWVMGEDDRLETRRVDIAFRGREHAYITAGLEDGDRAIATNLQAPVEGMRLRTEGERVAGAGEPRGGGDG